MPLNTRLGSPPVCRKPSDGDSEGEYQLLKLDTAKESAELACSILAIPRVEPGRLAP
jgi:hypothetical protein